MSFTDLLIVYFSLGAPVAIERLFSSRGRSAPHSLFAAASGFLLWPAVAPGILRRQIGQTDNSTQTRQLSELDSNIDKRLTVLAERIWHEIGCATAAGEFRDIVARYVALHKAAEIGAGKSKADEFLTAAGRTDVEPGRICFERRNAARLKRHQTDASRDLSAAVARASERGVITADTVRMIGEIAGDLNDLAISNELSVLYNRTGREQEGTSWNPHELSPLNGQNLLKHSATYQPTPD